ncbi:MAG: GNAT family N-acetyltransferase [Alphaproteobacteria bacterium]|nr:GNAT family N-acetyltransferase [Alphaproteobacteria bacterium]
MNDSVKTLETEHLILRQIRYDDFEPYCAFYATDRSRYRGGPLDRLAAWQTFAAESGHWTLRGYGPFALEEKQSGAFCGVIGPTCAEGWPEPEMSWLMMDGFEGRGYAHEAAQTCLRHVFNTLGWTTAISLILEGNERSMALAERLGASYERKHDLFGAPALIYRHNPQLYQ